MDITMGEVGGERGWCGMWGQRGVLGLGWVCLNLGFLHKGE